MQCFLYLFVMLPQPTSTLFPYTTLFRSCLLLFSASFCAAEDVKKIHPSGYVSDLTSSAAQKDRKSTRLNSSHRCISYAVFCLKKKTKKKCTTDQCPIWRETSTMKSRIGF